MFPACPQRARAKTRPDLQILYKLQHRKRRASPPPAKRVKSEKSEKSAPADASAQTGGEGGEGGS